MVADALKKSTSQEEVISSCVVSLAAYHKTMQDQLHQRNIQSLNHPKRHHSSIGRKSSQSIKKIQDIQQTLQSLQSQRASSPPQDVPQKMSPEDIQSPRLSPSASSPSPPRRGTPPGLGNVCDWCGQPGSAVFIQIPCDARHCYCRACYGGARPDLKNFCPGSPSRRCFRELQGAELLARTPEENLSSSPEIDNKGKWG